MEEAARRSLRHLLAGKTKPAGKGLRPDPAIE